MSKSRGNVVSPKDLVEKLGVDGTRYILLRALDFRDDSDFTWKRAETLYNSELANELGNALQRVIKLAKKNDVKGIEKQIKPSSQTAVKDLYFMEELQRIWAKYIRPLNQKIDSDEPWDKSGEAAKELIKGYLVKLNKIADLLEIFMPDTTDTIRKQLKSLKAKPIFPKIK